MTKAQEEEKKDKDQVKLKRMSSLCERRFFFPIDVEFMWEWQRRQAQGDECW